MRGGWGGGGENRDVRDRQWHRGERHRRSWLRSRPRRSRVSRWHRWRPVIVSHWRLSRRWCILTPPSRCSCRLKVRPRDFSMTRRIWDSISTSIPRFPNSSLQCYLDTLSGHLFYVSPVFDSPRAFNVPMTYLRATVVTTENNNIVRSHYAIVSRGMIDSITGRELQNIKAGVNFKIQPHQLRHRRR